MNAEQLTNAVRGLSSVGRPERETYRSVSDHSAHAQIVQFDDIQFTLITLNVLLPRCVPYINGMPMPGQTLPGWYKGVESQMGLEGSPFASPYDQTRRERLIIDTILATLTNSHRTVICLQECGSTLRNALLDRHQPGEVDVEVPAFDMHPSVDRDVGGRITLWTRDMRATVGPAVDNLGHSLRITGKSGAELQIHNVHLPFKTEASRAELKRCIEHSIQHPSGSKVPLCVIVGDFNIPTMPQSKFVHDEGLFTSDLIDTTEWITSSYKGSRVVFALHPRHFTNWAPKINCENPEENWDHMDNIMVVIQPGVDKSIKFSPAFWAIEYY